MKLKDIGESLKTRKSTILTAFGVAAMFTGTILAVKATPKAIKAKEKAEKKKGGKLTAVETVKTCGKYYVGAGVATIVGAGCIIKSDITEAKEKVGLTSALIMSETARTKLEEKTVEVVGEKKAQAIRDEVNKDILANNPVSTNTVMITEKGNTLIMDSLSRQYFKADIDWVKKQVAEFNMCLTNWRCGNGHLTINDWYDMISISHVDDSIGTNMGWDSDSDYMDIYFTAGIADNGDPCLVMGYTNPPRWLGL